jgi:hypothetical protein
MSQVTCEDGTNVSTRKLRHREDKELDEGHSVGKLETEFGLESWASGSRVHALAFL